MIRILLEILYTIKKMSNLLTFIPLDEFERVFGICSRQLLKPSFVYYEIYINLVIGLYIIFKVLICINFIRNKN